MAISLYSFLDVAFDVLTHRERERSGRQDQDNGQDAVAKLWRAALCRSAGGWERVKTVREKKVYQRNDERILGDGAFVKRVPASAQEIEVLVMEEWIYVKETPEKGLGVFAARDILKDEIITEFKGPEWRWGRCGDGDAVRLLGSGIDMEMGTLLGC